MSGDYIGTWVGVNDAGDIKSASVFTAERGNENDAIKFVAASGLELIRLATTRVRLGSNISEYGALAESGASHEHGWRLDLSVPVMTTNPPLYTYRCACGEWKTMPAAVRDEMKRQAQ